MSKLKGKKRKTRSLKEKIVSVKQLTSQTYTREMNRSNKNIKQLWLSRRPTSMPSKIQLETTN